MATQDLVNGESAPNLKPASHTSKALRPLRRRRSRSWHFEGWESRPAAPRIRPSFGATTPPAPSLDAAERPLQPERTGGFPGRDETAGVAGAGVGVSPSSKKWLSFFGKRKKISSISTTSGSAAAAGASARGRNEDVAGPHPAREASKADAPRNREAAALAVPEQKQINSEESAAAEGGRSDSASRTLPVERPPQAEDQAKLRFAGGKAAPEPEAELGNTSLVPAPRPTLPTYEEARRRTQQQQQQQLHPRGGVTATAAAAGFASPPAAASSRSGDAKSTGQGRRRDSSGVSLRRGGTKPTTGLEAGARVVCLDIFMSAIGGDEMRQWRPAEVGGVGTHADRELRHTAKRDLYMFCVCGCIKMCVYVYICTSRVDACCALITEHLLKLRKICMYIRFLCFSSHQTPVHHAHTRSFSSVPEYFFFLFRGKV